MKLIKFSAIEYECDYILFINPDTVSSIYDLSENSTGVHTVGGEKYEVTQSIEDVFKALTGLDYDA